MKLFRAPFLVAAALLGLAGCKPAEPAKTPGAPKPKVTEKAASAPAPAAKLGALPVIGPAPAWKLKDLNGATVSSEQLKGKVVVLDFWATWCPPCRQEIPGYTELQKKYGPQGLAIVGVSLDEAGPAVVKDFAGKFKINYQMLMADEAVQTAFGGVEAIPTTFLIDRDGKIRDRKVGSEPTEEYEQKIKTLIN
jgi:thiol-disulfide isomerase/thioredoxin